MSNEQKPKCIHDWVSSFNKHEGGYVGRCRNCGAVTSPRMQREAQERRALEAREQRRQEGSS